MPPPSSKAAGVLAISRRLECLSLTRAKCEEILGGSMRDMLNVKEYTSAPPTSPKNRL